MKRSTLDIEGQIEKRKKVKSMWERMCEKEKTIYGRSNLINQDQ